MISESEEDRNCERNERKKRDPRQFFDPSRKKFNENKYISRREVVKTEEVIRLFDEHEIDDIKNISKKRIKKKVNGKIEFSHV